MPYELEPEMITSLFEGDQRPSARWSTTMRCPKFGGWVLAIEDRRFFQHSGVNFVRLCRSRVD